MSSSSFRRLHELFAPPTTTTSFSSQLKALKVITAVPAGTRKPPPTDPLFFPWESNLKLLVKKFKRACNSERFRHKIGQYETTVRRLAAAKQFSYIEDILEHQKKYDSIANEGFTVRLITLYGKYGMFDHAYKLFDEMPQLNCKRTVMSFNALLAACVNSKKFDKVSEFFGELPEKLSIEPDTVSYNTVVKAFCEMGSFDSAVLVIDEMERNGLEPDLISFNMLLDAFYRNNRFSEAEKLWDVMERKNLVPNTRSYNPKLRALVADNRVSEAVELFKEMRNKGVEPDVFSFNAVIKRFVDAGNLEETKKWYGEMEENGCVPDLVTFRMLIPFACVKVDFEFAFELCKKAINEQCLIDRATMQRVVDGLVKELNVDQAKELVGLRKSCRYLRYKLKMPED